MRGALAALTTRGRSFLAAGSAALLCAFVLGEHDLLRIAVLILALPLLAMMVVARTRYRLSCARRLDPARVEIGAESQVTLRLENVTRLPTGLLLIEDQIPFALGNRPRFVLDRVEARGAREIVYRVRSDLRGRYQLGPLSVRIADPFGLVELVRAFTITDSLTVMPRVVALPPARLSGEWTGGGESRTRAVSSAGDDDVAPREYRQGDDLRRVHWRSTARHGELMVRREEQQRQSRGALFLDTRRQVHGGEGAGSSFETAVSAAASIGVHLAKDGLGLRYVTDEGSVHLPEQSLAWSLLDHLALIRQSGGRSLDRGVSALKEGGGDGLIVAVLGSLSDDELTAFARLRHGGITGVAVLLDLPTWLDLHPSAVGPAAQAVDRAAETLRGAGWRIVRLAAGQSLSDAWPAVAQHGRIVA
ncbi:DUF58 domain-containing protein [Rhizohabitans arisaemae]|uniref:DUF58 domain-containing protein n=1 Tax=Rhizohabitans arisaemae TaxID=2720610 RepID=UPI0024B0BA40|nr:DUF58 domain-containing protein [Rhizohabitans arisaemae]